MYILKFALLTSFCPLLFPLFSHNVASNDWVSINLDSVASLEFPGQPTFQTINGMKTYFLRAPEVLYIAMIVEDEKNHPSDAYSFYLGVIDSMIKDTRSTLSDSSSFYLGRHRGIDFTIVGQLSDGNEAKRKCRAVAVNNKLYCWSNLLLGEQTESSKEISKRYFESFSIK